MHFNKTKGVFIKCAESNSSFLFYSGLLMFPDHWETKIYVFFFPPLQSSNINECLPHLRSDPVPGIGYSGDAYSLMGMSSIYVHSKHKTGDKDEVYLYCSYALIPA